MNPLAKASIRTMTRERQAQIPKYQNISRWREVCLVSLLNQRSPLFRSLIKLSFWFFYWEFSSNHPTYLEESCGWKNRTHKWCARYILTIEAEHQDTIHQSKRITKERIMTPRRIIAQLILETAWLLSREGPLQAVQSVFFVVYRFFRDCRLHKWSKL